MFGRFVGLATAAREAIARIARSFISQAREEARQGPLYFLAFEGTKGAKVSGFGTAGVKSDT
jgi:hypothetical protein